MEDFVEPSGDGESVSPDFQLMVVPASRRIYVEMACGMLAQFAKGAMILPLRAAPAAGAAPGPRRRVNVISGKQELHRQDGNVALTYTWPPASVAASSVTGG